LSDCVLTLQALCEFSVVVTRKAKAVPDEAAASVDDFRDLFPVVAADTEALTGAMQANQERGMAFWDAMLWATARKAECGLPVGEYLRDGRQLGGLHFLNPLPCRVSSRQPWSPSLSRHPPRRQRERGVNRSHLAGLSPAGAQNRR
jgi:predicted nucleic acid-binding protein